MYSTDPHTSTPNMVSLSVSCHVKVLKIIKILFKIINKQTNRYIKKCMQYFNPFFEH